MTMTMTSGEKPLFPPFFRSAAAILVFFSICLSLACGPNEGILRSGREPQPPSASSPAISPVEKDVDDMRTASFVFIYVLRRRDGGPIDAQDRAVIRAQTPDTNRRVASDDGKAFTIGSNLQIAADKMAILMARFVVEDHSPVPEASPSPENVNIKQ